MAGNTEGFDMNGTELIAAERKRQIDVEGWTAEHDSHHSVLQLSAAAAAYVMAEGPDAVMPQGWPWDAKSWKPKDRERNLVRAGALYLAAADRSDGIDKRAGRKLNMDGWLPRAHADICAMMIDLLATKDIK
jgi:hypothetical protein